MSKPGRPPVLDDAKRREACAIISVGCRLHTAARYLGCSKRTLQREIERNEEFRQRVHKVEVGAEVEVLNNIRQASRTHWRAGAWYLQRIRPGDYAFAPPPMMHLEFVQELINCLINAMAEAVPDQKIQNRVRKHLYKVFQWERKSRVTKYGKRRPKPLRAANVPLPRSIQEESEALNRHFEDQEEEPESSGQWSVDSGQTQGSEFETASHTAERDQTEAISNDKTG